MLIRPARAVPKDKGGTQVNKTLLLLMPAATAIFLACDNGVHYCDTDLEYQFHQLLPMPDEGWMADPHVIRVGCTWYLYATHSQVDLQVWYSDDLTNWIQGPTIWAPTQDWQTEGNLCGIWAPHVEPAGDKFFLYYSANCRIGVAVANDPLGPFVDVYDHPLVGNGYGGVGDGQLVNDLFLDYDDLAIDAFVLQTAGGQRILFHNAFTPASTVHAQEMPDFVSVSGKPLVMIEPDLNSWEGFIREGTWVLEHEGVFHLMYSGNDCFTAEYAIGVATATNPMGPYVRDPRNPILQKNPESEFWGPGHHSVTYDATGKPLMFYHTKTTPAQGEDRLVRYGPLWFDELGRVNVEQP